MKQSLTYILGAGASYQSIPVVASFPKRFKHFVYSLNAHSNNRSFDHLSDVFKKATSISFSLLNEFESHQSFDTFFKKLFHKNNFGEIKKYKKILNLYFIWEHVQEVDDSEGQPVSENNFIKQSHIDKRYDALIGGLLQPIKGEKKLFCKTNFITWNYDMHLLSAVKNYFYPDITFGELMERFNPNDHEWKITEQVSILNMNGFFYSKVLDDLIEISTLKAFDLIKNKLTPEYFNDDYEDTDAEYIRFAWENENFEIVTKAATDLIMESKNIVVIGYTFPLYNRLVDKNYFKIAYWQLDKYVVIQDPNVELVDNIISDFDLENQRRAFKEKTQCGSFYVPQDIF